MDRVLDNRKGGRQCCLGLGALRRNARSRRTTKQAWATLHRETAAGANPLKPLLDRSVMGDGRVVHFQFYDPAARSVHLRGAFGGTRFQSVPLRHLGGGAWVVGLLLPPGTYEYHFLADGKYRPDPLAFRFKDGPTGTLNSVLTVH